MTNVQAAFTSFEVLDDAVSAYDAIRIQGECGIAAQVSNHELPRAAAFPHIPFFADQLGLRISGPITTSSAT